jgi:UPF0755 protein
MLRRLLGLAAVICLIGGGLWVYRYLDRTLFGDSGGAVGPLVSVRIPPGTGVGDIGDILDAAGVVSNGQAWALRVRINGDGDQLQPGSYRLHRNEPYAVIIQTLAAGPKPTVVTRKLTIPEGWRITDIAARVHTVGVSRASYLKAVHKARPPVGFRPTGKEKLTMEGFLFPATYDVRKPPSASALVGQQLAAFAAASRKVDFSYATKKHLTHYDVVIIASLIEREARYPADRARIAAVIYNRLHRGMPLGIDATVQYAAGSWRVPTAADLQRAGAYSRDRPGLPPTAISNPGLASLQAAAHPAKVPYLYYVAIPGDAKHRHFFTASFSAFQRFQQEHPAG